MRGSRACVVVLGLLCFVESQSPLAVHGQAREAYFTPWLDTALRQGTTDQRHTVWVYFRDKGARLTTQSTSLPVSARALGRRAMRAKATAWNAYEDQAVAPAYTEEVSARVSRVRHTLRWLNAMSVEATPHKCAPWGPCHSSTMWTSCADIASTGKRRKQHQTQ